MKFIPLALIGLVVSAQTKSPSAGELLEEFKNTVVFWKQFDVAKKLVALHDTSAIPALDPWLLHEDRHLRGNAAFVVAALGDNRGFAVIQAILADRSDRLQGQGSPGGLWSLAGQIRADRYYAVHLFGDLKDARAVPIIVPLLRDEEVKYVVPWALGEIGKKSAIPPLIEMLSDTNPDMRVLAIYALTTLGASEALPAVRRLLIDQERIHFDGLIPVSQAAGEALLKLEGKR